MTKGRRSYSHTDSYGFLSHLCFLYPLFPLLCLCLTSSLLGWRVAVSIFVSPNSLARCRQMCHRCRHRFGQPSLAGALPSDVSPLPSALLSALIGRRVAIRCIHCRRRCRQPSSTGTLPSDASPLPSALPSALIGWRIAVSVAVGILSAAESQHNNQTNSTLTSIILFIHNYQTNSTLTGFTYIHTIIIQTVHSRASLVPIHNAYTTGDYLGYNTQNSHSTRSRKIAVTLTGLLVPYE